MLYFRHASTVYSIIFECLLNPEWVGSNRTSKVFYTRVHICVTLEPFMLFYCLDVSHVNVIYLSVVYISQNTLVLSI
jgi:hypothetical protein